MVVANGALFMNQPSMYYLIKFFVHFSPKASIVWFLNFLLQHYCMLCKAVRITLSVFMHGVCGQLVLIIHKYAVCTEDE